MRFLPQMRDFYADQKDAIKNAIEESFKKFDGESPPGKKKSDMKLCTLKIVLLAWIF